MCKEMLNTIADMVDQKLNKVIEMVQIEPDEE